MAGIGVKLQTIFEKKTIVASFVGFIYSTMRSEERRVGKECG